MPPELKKPITCMEQMTCENCVFSNKPGDMVCNNSNSDNWYRDNGEFCSEGQWLFYREWLCEENTPNPEEKLYLCDYWELYTEFAREVKGNDNV